MHVVLVGPMGVGKSTVGRALAQRLDRPLRDSDDDLVALRGVTGQDVAETYGVAELHRWEAGHLLDALARREPVVIAAAASVVDDEAARRALGAPFVAWLRAPVEVLVARARRADHRRVLGPDPAREMARLAGARRDRYAAVADLSVDVDGADPADVVRTVVAALPDGACC